MDFVSQYVEGLGSLLPSLLAASDFFWNHPIFAKDQWEVITRFVRMVLALGGAGLLIYEVRARRLRQPIPERTRRRAAILLTGLAFLTYFDFFNPNVRYSEYYHRHEFYHYYLGSKYNDELGYTRLYECTAIAENELGHGQQLRKRELRDLRVNLIKPIPDTYVFSNPEQCKQHFKTERWDAFKQDVNWFYTSARGTYWENMLKDHGYNPPPVWTMTGKFFANFAPAGDSFFKLLAAMDVALNLGMLLVLGWGFGWRVMAVGAIFWGCNGPANFYWTGGAFLRQDWLFLLVAATALARRRRFALAGAALTWSALLRVFPLILFAGWGIIIAIEAMRRWRGQKEVEPEAEDKPRWHPMFWMHPDHRRLVMGCLLATAVLVPTSIAATGLDAYRDFYEHISVHKNTPLTNTMGLETMVVHTWDGRMHVARNDSLDDPFQEWKQGRLDRFQERKPVFFAIIAATGLWMIWALRRTKLLWVGPPVSLLLAMSLTNLTCYYYSMFIIGAVIVASRPTLGPAYLAASGASQVVLANYYWVDDKFTAMSWLFYLIGLMILYVYSRPFSIARLVAWWENRPEPRSRAEEARLAKSRVDPTSRPSVKARASGVLTGP